VFVAECVVWNLLLKLMDSVPDTGGSMLSTTQDDSLTQPPRPSGRFLVSSTNAVENSTSLDLTIKKLLDISQDAQNLVDYPIECVLWPHSSHVLYDLMLVVNDSDLHSLVILLIFSLFSLLKRSLLLVSMMKR